MRRPLVQRDADDLQEPSACAEQPPPAGQCAAPAATASAGPAAGGAEPDQAPADCAHGALRVRTLAPALEPATANSSFYSPTSSVSGSPLTRTAPRPGLVSWRAQCRRCRKYARGQAAPSPACAAAQEMGAAPGRRRRTRTGSLYPALTLCQLRPRAAAAPLAAATHGTLRLCSRHGRAAPTRRSGSLAAAAERGSRVP